RPCASPLAIDTSATRGARPESSLAAIVAVTVTILPFGGQICDGDSVIEIVGGVMSRVVMANGSSVSVRAHTWRRSKLGAGDAGARMVRSTKRPSSACRIRTVSNVAASVIHGTLKQIVMAPPIEAVVVTW